MPGKTEIVENIAAPDILVSADPVQLLRAFVNLAVNALQAMEETGGRLTITLETVRKEGTKHIPATEYALIRFADTGHGMKEKTTERMFDPFFTTGKNGKGTGIGLTLVHDIISDLNGDIKVSSRVKVGTVIDVLIPAVKGRMQKLTD
jgi:signal transduction histidine kinase